MRKVLGACLGCGAALLLAVPGAVAQPGEGDGKGNAQVTQGDPARGRNGFPDRDGRSGGFGRTRRAGADDGQDQGGNRPADGRRGPPGQPGGRGFAGGGGFGRGGGATGGFGRAGRGGMAPGGAGFGGFGFGAGATGGFGRVGPRSRFGGGGIAPGGPGFGNFRFGGGAAGGFGRSGRGPDALMPRETDRGPRSFFGGGGATFGRMPAPGWRRQGRSPSWRNSREWMGRRGFGRFAGPSRGRGSLYGFGGPFAARRFGRHRSPFPGRAFAFAPMARRGRGAMWGGRRGYRHGGWGAGYRFQGRGPRSGYGFDDGWGPWRGGRW
jgi:hypothetical protein